MNVLVAGQQVVTDKYGVCTVPVAPATFDVTFASPEGQEVYAYQNLSDRVIGLYPAWGFENGWQGSGHIAAAPPAGGRVTAVVTSNDQDFDVAGSGTSLDLHWASASSEVVHVAAVSFDPAIGAYTANAEADLTVDRGATINWQPNWRVSTANDAKNDDIAVARVLSADGSPATVTAFFTTGRVDFESASAPTGLVTVPYPPLFTPKGAPPISLYLHASAKSANGAEVALESVSLVDTLTLPAPIDAVSPEDGATVSSTTTFTTTGHGTIGVELTPAQGAPAGTPRIHVLATDSARIPDLAALGFHIAPGTRFTWRATQYLDDAPTDVSRPFLSQGLRQLRHYATTPPRTIAIGGT